MKTELTITALLSVLSVTAFASPSSYECAPEYSDSLNVAKVLIAKKTGKLAADQPTEKTVMEMKVQQKSNLKKTTYLNYTLTPQEISDFENQFNGGTPLKGIVFRTSDGKKAVMANLEFVVFGGSQRHRLYLTLAVDGQVVENLNCN